MRAISFLIETCFSILLSIYLLRMILQWVRANFRNPITQVITRITNPLVLPLRKILPPLGKLDTASLFACFFVSLVMTLCLAILAGMSMNDIFTQPQRLAIICTRRLLLAFLQLYWVLIFFSIILNWVQAQQHSPLSAFLHELTEPVLRPARKIIKPIGGLDLSPIPVLLILTALQIQFGF